jgi:hypothetical protein
MDIKPTAGLPQPKTKAEMTTMTVRLPPPNKSQDIMKMEWNLSFGLQFLEKKGPKFQNKDHFFHFGPYKDFGLK